MKKIEMIWRELLFQAIERKNRQFTQKELAKKLGIDLIITDHHKQLDTIPDGFAVINPHISPKMRFTEMCGATVAFKVMR